MTTEQNDKTYILPVRYRQALEDIEAAGGTVSEFMLDLVEEAEQKGLRDEDVIQILKNHYQNRE